MKIDKDVQIALREAQKLISSPDHWVQLSYREKTKDKVSFCAVGAVQEVIKKVVRPPKGSNFFGRCMVALNHALPKNAFIVRVTDVAYAEENEGYITDFNDGDATTHKNIMSLFKNAIIGSRMR